jgi:hypothetical protein
MTIVQIGGIGFKKTEPAEFYLQDLGKEKVLIFRARKRCQPGAPRFISDQLILLRPCNDNVVVDKKGRKVYDMPRLSFYYLTMNRDGTRFAVYERDESFFHQFEGTDRLRVKVFRSSDGTKLFDYRWHLADEATNDGRIALSDDGSLLGMIAAAGESTCVGLGQCCPSEQQSSRHTEQEQTSIHNKSANERDTAERTRVPSQESS